MKTSYLFPHRLKTISGVVFVVSFLLLVGFYVFDQYGHFELKAKVFAIVGDKEMANSLFGKNVFFDWVENSVTDEVLMLLAITSGIVFAFCKEKHEDEMVAALRLHSLAWATIINYTALLLSYLFIYGMVYLNVLMATMFMQLVIFIVLFRFKMYRFYISSNHEE